MLIGNKLLTAFIWIALSNDAPWISGTCKYVCLNHDGVTAMEWLEQGHLHSLHSTRAPRETHVTAENRTQVACFRKGLFEQLVLLLFGTSIALNVKKGFYAILRALLYCKILQKVPMNTRKSGDRVKMIKMEVKILVSFPVTQKQIYVQFFFSPWYHVSKSD